MQLNKEKKNAFRESFDKDKEIKEVKDRLLEALSDLNSHKQFLKQKRR